MSLTRIAQVFRKNFPFEELNRALRPGTMVHLKNFAGSTPSLLLSEYAKQGRPLLLIASDTQEAQYIASDLAALGVEQPLFFPPDGTKPYDFKKVNDPAVTARRTDVIDQIIKTRNEVVITSAEGLFKKMADISTIEKASLLLHKDREISPMQLSEQLLQQDYLQVSFVNDPGEFSRRGGIVDIYPFSGSYPFRIEFFGDVIDSIREFDPDSQRSINHRDHIRLVPGPESFSDSKKVSLLSFFPDDTLIVEIDFPGILQKLNQSYQEAEKRYAEANGSTGQPLPRPAESYLSGSEYAQERERHTRLLFGSLPDKKKPDHSFSIVTQSQPDFNSSVRILREDLARLSEKQIETLLLCDNEGQRNRFEELLGEPGPQLNYSLSVSSLHRGFILPEMGIAVYTDHQVFNRYYRPKTKIRAKRGGISFKELKDLNIGDYVVHIDHGIGVFSGFKKISVRGTEQESVVVRYKNDSILYVNVSALHKIQKYSGKDGTAPKITRLGTGEWARKKATTRKRVKDIARGLIELYAKRKSQKAFAFSADNAMQTELEASFMFVETPDQEQAIKQVKEDMTSETPMDRLVCGDVGFGKTEVAVRAAFKAVLDGKQAAVMVPTTILADQHWHTFKERMKSFAVNIDVLSRFRSPEKQKTILNRLKKGEIDILIGTHRIASKDVVFKDLGLLIIDEEQRFGVTVKEKLKAFRATVDVLTLTATPIPRTLQFSLMGARDLSIINTPPPNRQPVFTEIHGFDTRLIRDAIIQETNRAGQVFFIHNRVHNIEEIADMVRALVPDIRVRSAHGKMPGNRLEKVIYDFYDHKFDVLVSTNIIENGIDISNANTIIINQANQFGLSELHQLRGRVGRSNRKAFCYLITPPMETLTLEARRRLLALEEYTDLGSGFNIAMRDLDIRGAGDILGAEQSGFVNDVGFDMYHKILNDAIRELKENEFSELFVQDKFVTERPETTVEFDYSALLPQDYITDNVERLNLYRRLSGAQSLEEIKLWEEEAADRFGPLPEAAHYLLVAARIKHLASRLWLSKVTIRAERMWLQCPEHQTEAGNRFYDNGGMHHLASRLEALRPGKYQIIQKKETLRFVIMDIGDPTEALEMLQHLQPEKQSIDSPVEEKSSL